MAEVKQEIEFNFSNGKKVILKGEVWNKTFIHLWNYHKLRATQYDSPAPWLGSVSGGHPKPFSFIQVYCDTCGKSEGITYLDRFDINGNCLEEPLTEPQVREWVEEENKKNANRKK